MKDKYQTVYKASYGEVKAQFKNKMTLKKAEEIGKEYCRDNNFIYVKTERVE